jgi:hypothetical protein
VRRRRARAAGAHLRLSTAIELGQLGTGWPMLARSPAVGPSAEMHTSWLPLSSGTTMYLAGACVSSSGCRMSRNGHAPAA